MSLLQRVVGFVRQLAGNETLGATASLLAASHLNAARTAGKFEPFAVGAFGTPHRVTAPNTECASS